ncbi:hypothetical protein OHT59_00655 [Streptomyces sp. NBC_00243]|uniref:hypothetical protein n=1 Tax=Streptomyces sp. NBC_00243 TaxID=2975688 RepID=UPI002DDB2F86|nr:hypothetical protein [Streptomyces sp. NBC_00243]WRZ17116.1 hypothetical protein OHT59_00655 [Streptomyces sp. NBC_00243]
MLAVEPDLIADHSMILSATLLPPFGVADSGTALIQPWVVLAGLGVALLSSVIPCSLDLEALRKIPPHVFGILMSLEPANAAPAQTSTG